MKNLIIGQVNERTTKNGTVVQQSINDSGVKVTTRLAVNGNVTGQREMLNIKQYARAKNVPVADIRKEYNTVYKRAFKQEAKVLFAKLSRGSFNPSKTIQVMGDSGELLRGSIAFKALASK